MFWSIEDFASHVIYFETSFCKELQIIIDVSMMLYNLMKCFLSLFIVFFYNFMKKKGVIHIFHFTGEKTESQKSDLPKVPQLVGGGDSADPKPYLLCGTSCYFNEHTLYV